MKRASVVCAYAWLCVIVIVVTTHAAFARSVALTCVASSVALFAIGCFIARWRRPRPARRSAHLLLSLCVTSLAVLYGLVYARYCPNQPPIRLGVTTEMEGVVTHVTQTTTASEVQLTVTAVGTPPQKSSISAFWTTYGQVSLQPGSRVQIDGMFVALSAGDTGLQQWLAPEWGLRGQLLSSTPPKADAASLYMANAMEATAPGGRLADADLALSMVIGRAVQLSDSVKNMFLAAGVTHLLAASGANVVLFCRALSLLWAATVRLAGIRSWHLEHVYLLCGVWVFVGLCDGATPLVRAAIMMTYVLLGRMFHRRTTSFTCLSVSCFVFALWQPYALTSISGILSIMATFAVGDAARLCRPARGETHQETTTVQLNGRWSVCKKYALQWGMKLWQHFFELFFTSVIVDVYMIPLVWWWFQQWTPYGVIATVIAEPLLVILLPLTLGWGVLAMATVMLSIPWFTSFTTMLADTDVYLVHKLTQILAPIAAAPDSLTTLPTLPLGFLLLYYAGVVGGQRWKKIKIAFFHMHKFFYSRNVATSARVKSG